MENLMAKVLIVDDEMIVRLHIKKMLTSLGHEVIGEASGGFSAIELYKNFHPDIVTMDLIMPEENNILNGIEAIKKIIEYDKNAKIVVITSQGEQIKVIQAIQNGAINYIMKPLSLDKIKSIFDQTLGY